MNRDNEESLRFFASLGMTPSEGLAMTIRVAKRPLPFDDLELLSPL